MAFTGYELNLSQAIQCSESPTSEGRTFQWCRDKARQFGCLVVCGYPEFVAENELYNSIMVMDRDGTLVKSIRKTFLYEADTWAREGAGFQSWYCPWLQLRISFGICMDINPYKFESPFEAFEFAREALNNQSQLILFSCAWTDSAPEDSDPSQLFNYWATRLTPLIDHYSSTKKPCYFICANRIGKENDTTFAGSSCVIALHTCSVKSFVDKTSQALLVADIKESFNE